MPPVATVFALLLFSISFPCLSFCFASRGNSMFLTDRGQKTKQSVEPKKKKKHPLLIRAIAVLSVAATLSVTSSLAATHLTCGYLKGRFILLDPDRKRQDAALWCEIRVSGFNELVCAQEF